MSKRKYKSPDYQIRFLSRGNQNHENFARIFRSMFEDKKYISLSNSAKDILIGIILNCNKDSRDRCLFPYSAYSKRCSKATFHKAIAELSENGFIRVVCCKTAPNIYFLCEDWKLDEIPKREPELYDISEYRKLRKGLVIRNRMYQTWLIIAHKVLHLVQISGKMMLDDGYFKDTSCSVIDPLYKYLPGITCLNYLNERKCLYETWISKNKRRQDLLRTRLPAN